MQLGVLHVAEEVCVKNYWYDKLWTKHIYLIAQKVAQNVHTPSICSEQRISRWC